MAAKRLRAVANALVLAVILVPVIWVVLGTAWEHKEKLVEDEQISKARYIQLAVENFAYINHGRYPRAVFHKGSDGRTMCSFLPGQRKLLNFQSGFTEEPRDYSEIIINRRPDKYAIYYRYYPGKNRYEIYCYNADLNSPLLILKGH